MRMHAAQREPIEIARAGDIVAAVGIKESITGDTLSTKENPVVYEAMAFPDTVISMSIEPESGGDRDKLGEVLGKLIREDPTFKASTDPADQPDRHRGHGRVAPRGEVQHDHERLQDPGEGRSPEGRLQDDPEGPEARSKPATSSSRVVRVSSPWRASSSASTQRSRPEVHRRRQGRLGAA
jgi:hypothetical protein